jgi:hypothetical protein
VRGVGDLGAAVPDLADEELSNTYGPEPRTITGMSLSV